MSEKMIVCEICNEKAMVDSKRKLNYCNKRECELEMKKRKRKETIKNMRKRKSKLKKWN